MKTRDPACTMYRKSAESVELVANASTSRPCILSSSSTRAASSPANPLSKQPIKYPTLNSVWLSVSEATVKTVKFKMCCVLSLTYMQREAPEPREYVYATCFPMSDDSPGDTLGSARVTPMLSKESFKLSTVFSSLSGNSFTSSAGFSSVDSLGDTEGAATSSVSFSDAVLSSF